MNTPFRIRHDLASALVCGGLLLPPPCIAAGPAPMHYVFVNRDRTRIHDAGFLGTPAIAGAEIKYTWKELEPERDHYSFTQVLEDLTFLESHGKRLMIQLQDATFDERINVPAYLLADTAFHGGAARKYEAPDGVDTARFDGWIARRWDPAVQERYARLLQALAKQLDDRVEALVLPETATEFGGGPERVPAGFTPRSWLDGILAQMTAARGVFTRSRVIQYANFMPGEWLPKDDPCCTLAQCRASDPGPVRAGRGRVSGKLLSARARRRGQIRTSGLRAGPLPKCQSRH